MSGGLKVASMHIVRMSLLFAVVVGVSALLKNNLSFRLESIARPSAEKSGIRLFEK
jgi:hypothetical protein